MSTRVCRDASSQQTASMSGSIQAGSRCPTEKVFAFPAMCKEDHFSIITVQPDQAVRAVHDRMPKVLDSSQARRWLGGEDVLSENGPALTLYQVTQKVNSPKDKTADVIRPERTLL